MCIRDRHSISSKFVQNIEELSSFLLLGKIESLLSLSDEDQSYVVFAATGELAVGRLHEETYQLECQPSRKYNTTIENKYRIRVYSRTCDEMSAKDIDNLASACISEADVIITTYNNYFHSQNTALGIGIASIVLVGLVIGFCIFRRIRQYKSEYENLVSKRIKRSDSPVKSSTKGKEGERVSPSGASGDENSQEYDQKP
eukprot:TRINITY_DN17935_c0_g1_i2.p1 TRINITY_DN17935_c0_g1~~TRINITY_DN17935_c0_g1_i2.p1  ORF type:complete len:200 (-),score=40.81 TRINITY_DN17935_c0_g1_i2:104-703(-)